MALEFIYRGVARPLRVALFPGAWNPPTIAHLHIARAAARWADEIVWVLPRSFPHKSFENAGFDDRRSMVASIARREPGFSAAVSDGGLYAEIADEAREFYGGEPEIALACGADAAERIAGWDYGEPDFFESMLGKYRLLVAARTGDYLPQTGHEDRVIGLQLDSAIGAISSTDVRRRIANGQRWEHLVPDVIVDKVRELYGIN